jgi:hypothetical protein
MSRRLPYRVLAVVLAAGLFTSGCSSSPFLGRQWTNFSAYYNTFYNAERSFEQAEQSILEGSQQINRSVYISVFPVSLKNKPHFSPSSCLLRLYSYLCPSLYPFLSTLPCLLSFL